MKIRLYEEILYEGQDTNQLTAVFHTAYKLIADKGQVYSHITVDGIDVYQDPLASLLAAGKAVENVVIKAVSVEKFKTEILCSISEYISRSIPELERLSGKFYLNPDQEAWHGVSQLLEGIQWIEKAVLYLSTNSTDTDSESLLLKFNVIEEVKMLEMAITQQDLVLVGDILKYEIISRFTNIEQTVKDVLKTKNGVEIDVIS
ncbi:hypothetical protein [Brevibacillus panacihumi]|nr:hypothetical protein [Brevibacillus panacihumi]